MFIYMYICIFDLFYYSIYVHIYIYIYCMSKYRLYMVYIHVIFSEGLANMQHDAK